MSKTEEANRRIAERICTSCSFDGHDYQEGDFLAMLDGKVVAVASNPREAIRALRKLAPDPAEGLVFEVGMPQTDVIRVFRS